MRSRFRAAAICITIAMLSGCSADAALKPSRASPATTFLSAGPRTQSLCAAPPAGLVGWWRGDGDATEIVNGFNGTLVGGTTFATGKVGGAIKFDGIDDGMDVGTHAALDVAPGPGFTLQAWIFPTGIGSTGVTSGPIFEYFAGVPMWSFGTTSLLGGFWDQQNGMNFLTPGVTQNAWNHVAFTWTRATNLGQLFVNGVAGTTHSPTTVFATWRSLHIGRRPPGSFPQAVGSYNGLIDDAQIYNRGLSAAEVSAVYNAGVSGNCQLVADAGSAQSGTEGSSVTFNGGASTGQSTADYDWNFGDGTGHGSGAAPGHAYADNGTYTVVLQMTDGLLQSSASTSATIANATPVPTLTLRTPAPIHVGQQFDVRAGFSDAGVADGPWGYKFYRNSTLLQQGTRATQPPPGATQKVTLTIGTVGTHTLRLEITDKDGAKGTALLQVQVVQ